MHCWLIWRVLVSSLILIKFSECCAVVKNRPIEEELKKNEDSPWLVLIIDKTVQEDDLVQGLSYGAIIQSDVVLTLASAVSKTPVEDLMVITNCSVIGGIECDTYSVTEMYFSKNDVKEGDPAILLLSTPLEFSATVSPVRLALSDVDFDPDDCVIHHWQVMIHFHEGQAIEEAGILNVEYKVSLNPDRFGMAKTEEAKMRDDIDCFIERCISYGEDFLALKNSLMQKISFTGSPIVCKLPNTDDQVFRGFATYTYKVDIDPDRTKDVSLVSGTLLEFSSDLDDFLDEVNNNQAQF